MPSKLGPHCLRASDGARKMIDAGCRIVKLVDDFGLAPELAAKPGVTLIGRVYASNPRTAEEQQKAGENPEAAARRFVDSQKEKYLLNPAIKLWEGHNEPVWGSHEEMRWYAEVEAARLKMLADMGLRGVVGCFATGAPGDIELWKSFIPAIEAVKKYNGVLGLHEYSSPWIWWMTGKYQLKDEDEGDTGWVTLRYRKIMRNYLKPHGLDDVPIAITEFGLDRVGYVPDGASTGNWRTNSDWWPSWDGSRDPIPYWRGSERNQERYYAEQMIWYDKEMRKDPNVLGATIFTLGHIDEVWRDYDIDGTAVVTHLCDYIRREANVPDAASAPAPATTPTRPVTVTTQPAAQPTPTQPPPAVVVTPPPGAATTGVNLLRNPSFDNGYYHWNNIPELAIPKEWDFWYLEDFKTRLPQQDHDFLKPETVVWNINDAPLEERKLFFIDGNYCLKVFKGWGPVWFKLSQKVSGLVPGQRYRFTMPIFPDLVMVYDPIKGKVFADDPAAGENRLTARSGGKEVTTDWLDGSKVPFGKYTRATLDFVANASDAEVIVEIRGRWGLVNNGWFLDSPRLEAIAAGAPASQPAPTSSAPAPQVAPSTPATPTQPRPAATSPAVTTAAPAPAGGNLLVNGTFDEGYYHWNNVPELAIPKGWDFWYLEDFKTRLDRQDNDFLRPETVVWNINDAPLEERKLFFLSGNYCLKVFKGWGPLWFQLKQTVNNLTPGARYRFTFPIFPDLVMTYDPLKGKVFANDMLAGEHRLIARTGGKEFATEWLDGNKVTFGKYTYVTLDFNALTTQAEMICEVRGRWGLANNGWFFDSPSLTAIAGAPAAQPQQPASPGTPTAQPSAPGGNLLQNPSFAGGVYQPNPNIRNLEAPNNWQFWFADEKIARVSKQPEPFRAPKAGVISAANAAADDRDGLAGGLPQAYRVVGNWRAIWFSISQPVRGLATGRRYRFIARLMPDPVDKYLPGNAKQFVADPDGGEVWLRAQSGGQKSETYKRVGADIQPGVYVDLVHEFSAAGADATVTIEVRARFPLTQNAWYIASASVQAI